MVTHTIFDTIVIVSIRLELVAKTRVGGDGLEWVETDLNGQGQITVVRDCNIRVGVERSGWVETDHSGWTMEVLI